MCVLTRSYWNFRGKSDIADVLEELAATIPADVLDALVAILGVDTLELASELPAEEEDAWLAHEPSGFLLVLGWRRRDDLRLSADAEFMSGNIYSKQ